MTNYPDIDNSILLFPDRWNTDNTTPLVKIHWMNFCMLWWITSKDNLINLKQYVHNYSFCPMRWAYNSNNTNFDRITTVNTLSQLVWITIWKTIVLPDLITSLSTYTPWSTKVLEINVWVLHSDWTISYFAQDIAYIAQYSFQRIEYSSSNWSHRCDNSLWKGTFIKCIPQTKIISTNWMIVQEWDRVYAHIWNKTSGLASKPISFWWLNACFEDDRLQPIQFSID